MGERSRIEGTLANERHIRTQLENNLKEAKEALRPFAEIAERYDPETWRAGPSPLYAILDECREAKKVFDKIGEGDATTG